MTKLYPFQMTGVGHLMSGRRRYLADVMGLGKTVQACRAAAELDVRDALVVAPASALENWGREWQLHGPRQARVEFVSYDRLTRKPHQYRGAHRLVVLDEAHYVKSRGAQRTLAALTVARAAERAFLLSGTPMPNHPGELWAPIRALWPAIPRALGIESYTEWLDRFCRWQHTPYGIKVWGAKNGAVLRPYLQQIMLRRTLATAGLQLPPLRIDVSLLPREPDDVSLMEEAELAGLERAMEQAAAADKLSSARRLLGAIKAPRVARIIAEELRTEQYKKVVVLAHHHDTLDLLREALAEFGVVGFTGRDAPAARQVAIDAFTNSPKARVFLGQQTAAGVAVNLQVATEVVLVEPSWSPDDNAQAMKRIHRIGSTLPCRARIFAIVDTLDEAVMQVTARKTRMQFEIMGGE